MSICIRDVLPHELDQVLALNNAGGPNILPLDAGQLEFFFEHAAYFRIGEIDDHIAGFLVAFGADSEYASPNYSWFREREASFVYIDRIVVANSRRGAGLGRAFYADIASFAEMRAPRLCCEVFLEPANDIALLFHGTYGFREIGQQVMPGVKRRVSMLAKELCSYPFIAERYRASGLPDEPWVIADRNRPAAQPQGAFAA